MSDTAKEALRAWGLPGLLLAIAGFLGLEFLTFKDQMLSSMAELKSDVSWIKVKQADSVTKAEMRLAIEVAILKAAKLK